MAVSHQLEAAASTAGVPEEAVLRYARLGLVDPEGTGMFSDADVRRIQVFDILERAGLPVDQLAELAANGQISFDFVESSLADVFTPLTDRTFAEVSETSGIPFETVAAMRESLGGAPPAPGDRLGVDELVILSLVEYQLAIGLRPHAIEQALRVYGESLRRIAETEAEWFRTEIVQPIVARGGTEAEAARYTAEISPRLAELSDAAVIAIYHRQQRHAWSANIIDGIAGVLERAGLHHRGDATPAMCFLDITGYTRLTEERGDQAAADLAEAVRRIVERKAVVHGGRAVKWLGDGVMLHFPDPGSAVGGGLDMVEALERAGMALAHVGIDAGPVLFREGDYYGSTVNVAARLADFARPGEVLVTEAVVDLAAGADLAFTEIGPVDLKGVGEPLVLLSAHRSPSAGT